MNVIELVKHAVQMQHVITIPVHIDVIVNLVTNKYQIVRFNAKIKESLRLKLKIMTRHDGSFQATYRQKIS